MARASDAGSSATWDERQEREALATQVINMARDEVDDEANEAPVAMEPPPGSPDALDAPPQGHGTPGSASGAGAEGAGAARAAEAGLDWAAAMERDAFESAAMQHGLADDGDDDDVFSSVVGGGSVAGGSAPK